MGLPVRWSRRDRGEPGARCGIVRNSLTLVCPMDDLTFSARRASAGASTAARAAEPADLETRFRGLVQSPPRAALRRYLSAGPEESVGVEPLMQPFGRLHLGVNSCVRKLVGFGV